MAIDLFQKVDFESHAGLNLSWKIEMDALTPKEWECIAHMIMELSRPFKRVIGIPRGGTFLGKLLDKHSTGKPTDPICIVDDVLTTGESMNDYKIKNEWRDPTEYIGWVVFARGPVPIWVDALFRMTYKEPDVQVMTLMGIKKDHWS